MMLKWIGIFITEYVLKNSFEIKTEPDSKQNQ